jgi:hypothetical protein
MSLHLPDGNGLNPDLHLHMNEPTVLMHLPWAPQTSLSKLHSSTSEQKIHREKKHFHFLFLNLYPGSGVLTL